MTGEIERKISPKISLISAFIVHACVEVPFFIFPIIVLVVGADLLQELGAFMWIGLGTLGTFGILAAGLPAPIFGWLADRQRHGLMMFLSLILGALGALIIGLFGNSFTVMMIGIGFAGLAVALYHPPGLSWVSSAFEDPDKGSYSANYNRILGIHGVGGTIGASLAPISIYFLYDSIGWRQIYLLWSIPLFVVAIGFWILVGRHESKNEYTHSLSRKPKSSLTDETTITLDNGTNSTVLIIYIFMIAMSLTYGMISFILSPFLSETKGFEISQAAFFVGFSHLLASSGQLIGGILGDKFNEKIALSFAAVLQIVTLIGIYVIDSSLILFVLYIFMAVVNAIFWPSTNSLLAKNTRHRGSAFGGFMFIVYVVKAFGPSIDGILISIDPSKYFWIFSLSCIFSVTAFISLLLLKTNPENT